MDKNRDGIFNDATNALPDADGRWRGGFLNKPGTSGIKLAVDAPAKSTVPDVYAIYTLTVTNPGKEREEYDLTIQNPQNAMASLSMHRITVEEVIAKMCYSML